MGARESVAGKSGRGGGWNIENDCSVREVAQRETDMYRAETVTEKINFE